MANREPIGSIKCPWCTRPAELHKSEERKKLDPESPDGAGKPAYPTKFFVICPPTTGYRGCGTTLANGAEAQARIMEMGHVFGPSGKQAPAKEAPAPPRPTESPKLPTAPVPPPKPATKSNPFKLW